MYMKPSLNQADVEAILAGAKAEAIARQWAVSIAVVDDGGQLLGFQRLDGAAPFTALTAMAKARTSALGRRDSKLFEEIISGGRTAFLSVPGLEGLLEGGVAVVHQGQVAGAVGVSGVKSPEDAQVARAGIATLVPS
jgi:uncharacterized protein GlcG (DUF336 family)